MVGRFLKGSSKQGLFHTSRRASCNAWDQRLGGVPVGPCAVWPSTAASPCASPPAEGGNIIAAASPCLVSAGHSIRGSTERALRSVSRRRQVSANHGWDLATYEQPIAHLASSWSGDGARHAFTSSIPGLRASDLTRPLSTTSSLPRSSFHRVRCSNAYRPCCKAHHLKRKASRAPASCCTAWPPLMAVRSRPSEVRGSGMG